MCTIHSLAVCKPTIFRSKMKHDNTTQYKIDDLTERQILIGYKVFLSTSSLIGDTLILVGSLRYNAIKLHEIIVIFVQHMAVADLLLTLFGIVPGAISLAANDWILGDLLCYLSYFVKDTSSVVLFSLTTTIALTKMLVIKYPLRSINVPSKAGHKAALCVWVTGCCFPAAALLKDNENMYFDYLIYMCDHTCTKPVWNNTSYSIYTTVIGLVFLISIAGTVFSSVMMLILAKRATTGRPEALQWRGVLTVLLTAAAHTLLALPMTVFHIAQFGKDPINLMYRYVWWITDLVVTVNFYILGLTVTSFREFLKRLLGCRSCSNEVGERLQKSEDKQGLLSVDN